MTASSPPPVYEVRNVGKSYGKLIALNNVSLALYPGEVVGLVGDNGAGKSTMVRILSGANQPDGGEILLEGQPCTWNSPHDALEAGIETLYQDSGIAPDLTVADNIFLGREILHKGPLGMLGFLNESAMRKRATEELIKVGVSVPAAGRPVAELSGGQRQGVAIGRAVTWARKIIILDEPTNHLGAKQAAEVLEIIKKAKLRGLAVVFITHTLPHVFAVTDRVVVLRLGQIVADAPTSSFTPDSLLKAITGLSDISAT